MAIANGLVDSGNVNGIAGFRCSSHQDTEWYLSSEVYEGSMSAFPGWNNRDHDLGRSVQVVWLVLADFLLSVKAEIERRSPRPLFLYG